MCVAGRARRRCCPPPSKSHWTLRGMSRCVLLSQPHFSQQVQASNFTLFVLFLLEGVPSCSSTSGCHYETLYDSDRSQLARAGKMTVDSHSCIVVLQKRSYKLVSVQWVRCRILTPDTGQNLKKKTSTENTDILNNLTIIQYFQRHDKHFVSLSLYVTL